jgi:hypothetical protein
MRYQDVPMHCLFPVVVTSLEHIVIILTDCLFLEIASSHLINVCMYVCVALLST